MMTRHGKLRFPSVFDVILSGNNQMIGIPVVRIRKDRSLLFLLGNYLFSAHGVVAVGFHIQSRIIIGIYLIPL